MLRSVFTLSTAAMTVCTLLASVTSVAASGSGAWSEVTSSAREAVAITGRMGRNGDRLWVARRGETLASVARETTGNVAHAADIARYNQLPLDAALTTGQFLYVPDWLAPVVNGARAERGRPSSADRVADTELFLPQERSPLIAATVVPVAAPAVQPIKDVHSQKLDMFVGEVQVLGQVSVERVAIGQGSIVQAEVLDNNELMVIAQQPGSTSLRLWHRDGRQSDYNIRVSESDPDTRVRIERMVRMKVRMVEFRKSALDRLGIDWSDSVNGPGLAIAGDAIGNPLFRPAAEGFGALPNTVNPFATYFGIASNITSRINLLASSGDAVTLAEPVLTARNGGSASFLAGGEVPYPSVGSNGQTIVQFKEYGIKLNVAPEVDDLGQVRALVETEISQIDSAVSIDGAPGLLTRRAQTQVNVRSGETIVISGLLSSESSSDLDKLPGIGSLPVIGAFFKSQSRREAVSELVIFVTPEVLEPRANQRVLTERERSVYRQTSHHIATDRTRLPLLD